MVLSREALDELQSRANGVSTVREGKYMIRVISLMSRVAGIEAVSSHNRTRSLLFGLIESYKGILFKGKGSSFGSSLGLTLVPISS